MQTRWPLSLARVLVVWKRLCGALINEAAEGLTTGRYFGRVGGNFRQEAVLGRLLAFCAGSAMADSARKAITTMP
jgi:hypothetical protein